MNYAENEVVPINGMMLKNINLLWTGENVN